MMPADNLQAALGMALHAYEGTADVHYNIRIQQVRLLKRIVTAIDELLDRTAEVHARAPGFVEIREWANVALIDLLSIDAKATDHE